jgi:hypothetical protein
MGLLDEAIREHLELKRRRGADPSEVAREQREALDPISAPAAPEGLEDSAEEAVAEDVPTEEHALDVDAAEALDGPGADWHAEMAPSAVSPGATTPARSREPEETAELDMSTVLDDEPRAQSAAGGDQDAHGGQPMDTRAQLEQGSAEGAVGPDRL